MKNLIGLMARLNAIPLLPLLSISICFFLSSFVMAQTQTDNFFPTADAYTEGGAVRSYNPVDRIRLENNYRIGYLKFDLTGITGTISNVQFQFTVFNDDGWGTLRIYKGQSNDWPENSMDSSNQPGQGALLAEITKPQGSSDFNIGDTELLTLDESQISAGTLTLILVHSNGNDFAISSIDNPNTTIHPKLIITHTTNSNTPVSGVSINQSNQTIELGTSSQLTANVSPSNATDPTISWSSSNSSIATVSSSGVVNALTEGSTTIMVTTTVGGFTDSVSINVTDSSVPPPTSGGYWSQTNSDVHYTLGNVGIGTTNIDGWQLAVGGKIRAEEIMVETGWADYVFEKGYNLPSLQEVERHIAEKGHLINIPSAVEVQANGIQLGEMNKLLLEKIEELTLYIIQQEKRIKILESQER